MFLAGRPAFTGTDSLTRRYFLERHRGDALRSRSRQIDGIDCGRGHSLRRSYSYHDGLGGHLWERR